jgi:hypothetical protein
MNAIAEMRPDIREVYLADKRHPFYSLQGGKQNDSVKHDPIKEIRNKWIWGHFTDALKNALEHPIKAGAH